MADSKKKIEEIPGVGESMTGKIQEIVKTGKLKQLEKLKKEIPSSLIEIMKLEQLGPERTKKLNQKLGIETIDDLQKAAEEGKIEKLEGFGKKTTENILHEIEEYAKKGGMERFMISEAEEYIKPMIRYLDKKLNDITVAGSYRRQKETVGDIDILATSHDTKKAMKHFTSYDDVDRVLSEGKTKSTVKLKNGLQVDLRLVKKKNYGAALLYFTGSKAHSVALRKLAQKKNLKVSEYGLFKGEENLAAKTEKSVYQKLGLKYIEPELREDNGEIEAAKKNKLPTLIKLEDIQGDLQTHSKYSDGKYTIKEMVKAAKDLGYEYYAVTDHSKKVSMANGMDEKKLRKQLEEIDKLNDEIKGIRILKSVEVDILEDGTLDLSDDVLKELDVVVCSTHYNLKLSREKQTNRILKAMDNKYFNILAHPTGRRIGKRGEIDFDLEKIMQEAKKKGCFLEINANPERLDLKDTYIKMAKDMGLKLSISTDAHSKENLNNMKYGVAQARRGWLGKKDVINTYTWSKLKKMLER